MKWFGNTSRVWQTALPGATTRTAAVFLAGQVHHAASPLRLFESGEWFLFAGSQTPLTVLSSSLTSVWMSAHLPQDESYKPFDLFPRPSVCDHVCGCVNGEKFWVGAHGGADGERCWVGGIIRALLCVAWTGPLRYLFPPFTRGTFKSCCTYSYTTTSDDEGVRKRLFWPPSQFGHVGKVTYLTNLWQLTVGICYIEHPYWPHNAGGLCN